jgi:hypothetical protein
MFHLQDWRMSSLWAVTGYVPFARLEDVKSVSSHWLCSIRKTGGYQVCEQSLAMFHLQDWRMSGLWAVTGYVPFARLEDVRSVSSNWLCSICKTGQCQACEQANCRLLRSVTTCEMLEMFLKFGENGSVFRKSFKTLNTQEYVPSKRPRWSRCSVLASSTEVRGFKPGRISRIFFRAKKSPARLPSEGK